VSRAGETNGDGKAHEECAEDGRRPLVVLDHVEPASALSAASAWASRGSPWRPGGLESRAPGQALQGAAQTGRVVQ